MASTALNSDQHGNELIEQVLSLAHGDFDEVT
jgi:hypothetical protein